MCARWQDDEALPSSFLSPDTSRVEIPVKEGSTGVQRHGRAALRRVVKAKAHHHDHATVGGGDGRGELNDCETASEHVTPWHHGISWWSCVVRRMASH